MLTIGVQADGKLVAGGLFQSIGGVPLNDLGGIARLNSDGSVDDLFNPGANGPVYAVAVQADGSILVAGQFSKLKGIARSCLGRIDITGVVDEGFDPQASGVGQFANCLAVDESGRCLWVVGSTGLHRWLDEMSLAFFR